MGACLPCSESMYTMNSFVWFGGIWRMVIWDGSLYILENLPRPRTGHARSQIIRTKDPPPNRMPSSSCGSLGSPPPGLRLIPPPPDPQPRPGVISKRLSCCHALQIGWRQLLTHKAHCSCISSASFGGRQSFDGITPPIGGHRKGIRDNPYRISVYYSI